MTARAPYLAVPSPITATAAAAGRPSRMMASAIPAFTRVLNGPAHVAEAAASAC
jgi:hypothetical protein